MTRKLCTNEHGVWMCGCVSVVFVCVSVVCVCGVYEWVMFGVRVCVMCVSECECEHVRVWWWVECMCGVRVLCV